MCNPRNLSKIHLATKVACEFLGTSQCEIVDTFVYVDGSFKNDAQCGIESGFGFCVIHLHDDETYSFGGMYAQKISVEPEDENQIGVGKESNNTTELHGDSMVTFWLFQAPTSKSMHLL